MNTDFKRKVVKCALTLEKLYKEVQESVPKLTEDPSDEERDNYWDQKYKLQKEFLNLIEENMPNLGDHLEGWLSSHAIC